LVQADVALTKDVVNLSYALGGGWQEDTVDINVSRYRDCAATPPRQAVLRRRFSVVSRPGFAPGAETS